MVNRGEEKVRVHINVVPRSTGNTNVFVDYANKLSRPFMFASALPDCPDFLFEILIEEGQRIISMLMSTRYRTYQDAF